VLIRRRIGIQAQPAVESNRQRIAAKKTVRDRSVKYSAQAKEGLLPHFGMLLPVAHGLIADRHRGVIAPWERSKPITVQKRPPLSISTTALERLSGRSKVELGLTAAVVGALASHYL
jgi:hypothetical protein